MKCHFVNRTSWHCSWSFASSWRLLNNCWWSSWSCSLSFKAIWDHLGSFKVKLDDLRSYWKLSMPSLILDFELFQSSLDFFLTFWEVYGWPDQVMVQGSLNLTSNRPSLKFVLGNHQWDSRTRNVAINSCRTTSQQVTSIW